MAQEEVIKLFDANRIRVVWDSEKEKYYFSIVDVIQVLTDTPNARKYWSVLKTRLKSEGSELATNCSQLKLQAADGKKYLTDVADTESHKRVAKWLMLHARTLSNDLAEVLSPISAPSISLIRQTNFPCPNPKMTWKN